MLTGAHDQPPGRLPGSGAPGGWTGHGELTSPGPTAAAHRPTDPPLRTDGYAAALVGGLIGAVVGALVGVALALLGYAVYAASADSGTSAGSGTDSEALAEAILAVLAFALVAAIGPWVGVIVGSGLALRATQHDHALRTALLAGCLVPPFTIATIALLAASPTVQMLAASPGQGWLGGVLLIVVASTLTARRLTLTTRSWR